MIELSGDALYRLALDHPDQIYVAICPLREGASEALEYVEFSLYPPEELDKNCLFDLYLTPKWPLQDPKGMPWAIASFPLSDKERIKELFAVHGFRLAEGAPRMMQVAPVVFVLVSVPDTYDPCPTPGLCKCTEWVHFLIGYSDNFFTLEGQKSEIAKKMGSSMTSKA